MSLFDIGSNLFNMSKGQIGKLTEELVKNGSMTANDAQGFVNNLLQKGQEQKNELRNFLRNELVEVLKEMQIAQKTDIPAKDELRKMIQEEIQKVVGQKNPPKKVSLEKKI
jgi:polyhydroxyalkanoate synthesis regulator phasin